MSPLFPSPAELDDETAFLSKLSPIKAQFFVPRFVEKPQDPIMETLKLSSTNSATEGHFRLDSLPKELAIISQQMVSADSPQLKDSFWLDVDLAKGLSRSNQIHSWDNLRSTVPKTASSGGFLSDQDSVVFAAAQHQCLPILLDSHSIVQYISLQDLLKNLKLTALGFSSLLHEWNSIDECFTDIGPEKGIRKRLIIEGKDEAISEDVVSLFKRLGTSLRRLEHLVSFLRSRPNVGPTTHAFAHAISTCLMQIRKLLATGPPSETQQAANHLALTPVLTYYAQHEELLAALSALCKRQDQGLPPPEYQNIIASPHELLSLIYEHLHNHIERQSSHSVIATFAFILTESCNEYFEDVSRSIGFGGSGQSVDKVGSPLSKHYPTFFPPELIAALPIAQQSLKLLRAAQPDHVLLQKSKLFSNIRWFWTSDQILAAVNGGNFSGHIKTDAAIKVRAQSPLSSTTYLPELAEFQVYDLEPGCFIGQSCFDASYTSAPTLALENFIALFPPSLPPMAPTLAHLTSLVVKPLLSHATTLSNTLLSLFLTLPPPLDIHSHLHLLRSYMLLMSPSFRTRLSAALFSDTGDFDADVKSSHRLSLGRGSQPAELRRQTWAVGLAPALLQKATWPPMDTDLSFFLRTVILDSFEVDSNEETRRSRAEEIENRLGFAVRDLSTEPGQDAWMNPLHIEALDFLYMDYKPPQPVDVIITPDILSKYQRVFTFLLRLLRVQHAIHAAFRMSNSADPWVFGTLVSARKMLLHFRFIAQSFLTNLAEYVYDTAIAGNLDPFIARLQQPEEFAKRHNDGYSDVFSLAQAHSDVMDAILTACLLRTAQKSAGGALRDVMELVLDFAVLIGELYRGRLEEYQAAPVLEKLYSQFLKKMRNLIKILNATVDKNASLRALLEVPYSVGVQERKSIGGIEALSHLLIRLDLGEYWADTGKRTT
ncbi:hypothetical protein GYMLUDRAFT_37627 [Collybiopsis luxurians FD-317 M1]|nr:hypothetical protein GYMLUDRAFT_37627 [Collybiopsis luxurians FD-317 M1]